MDQGISMTHRLPAIIDTRFTRVRDGTGSIVVLTGAGISPESGIPTFRGKEGYWVVGSAECQLQEMAAYAMFRRKPDAVWTSYPYWHRAFRGTSPGAGHRAPVNNPRQTKSQNSPLRSLDADRSKAQLSSTNPKSLSLEGEGWEGLRPC